MASATESQQRIEEDSLRRMNPVARAWRRLLNYLMLDAGPGPRLVKLCVPINMQKGGTLLFVVALMKWYGTYTPTAYAYLVLHGSYGLVWLLKEAVCPDPGWQVKVRVGSALISWIAVLGPYWIAPFLITSQKLEVSPNRIALSSIVYVLGVTLMIGSDTQKYFCLKARPGELITDGFFRRIRHPNYLGEMMVYGSFAALCPRWEPWGVLAWVWLGVFASNIMRKEARMARHGEAWKKYCASSWCLIPLIF